MAGKTMIPLLAFAAWSGTGKTTLLKKLIPALCARGIRPGLIKHTHHDMDVDKPGKDSYELRKAGAAQTIVASRRRWALMTETPDEEELDLQFLASRMDTSKLDLILVEGFKHEEIAKIVLFRDGAGHRPEELVIDRHVIAVASDVPLNLDVALRYQSSSGPAERLMRWIQQNTMGKPLKINHSIASQLISLRQCKKAIRQDGLLLNLMPGSSLFSHGETPHYHRRYGVSLSEFGMGSGGTTALRPPGKFCSSDRFCVLI